MDHISSGLLFLKRVLKYDEISYERQDGWGM